MATRHHPAVVVVALSQVLGLVLIVGAALVFPADSIRTADYLWGAAAGMAGVIGLVLLYEALATGVMSIVSPVTAVVGTAVPVMAGVMLGERPGTLAWIGIALGASATGLLGLAPAHDGVQVSAEARRRAFPIAVAAGAGFGLFFLLLDRTSDGSGFLPLVAGRCTAAVALVTLVVVRRLRPARLDRTLALPVMVAASGDIAANVLFLLATRRGLLTIVAVCVALYPAATVLLARVGLGERLTPAQVGGLVVAAGAVVLVTV
jgi:drug/metabolite transporter (DMT)-like permease